MSKNDVKPLVFRSLDGDAVVPAWLRQAPRTSVHPAQGALARAERSSVPPPMPDNDVELQEQEPEAFPLRPGLAPSISESIGQSVYRRSSLPPRRSAPPPPVVITRPPSSPPSVPPPPPPKITPAEQEAFATAALELGSLRTRVLSNAEGQLLELAVTIAEVLIEREVERDPALHEAFARAAVSALGDTRLAKMRVSRQAYKAITEVHGEESLEVDGVKVEMMLDNSLEGLSVVAESGASRVDGRVSERLGAVLRAIKADMRRHGMEDEG
ncbi:MAG TPA: FliH/SctL family protein [Polyangiales bacterium]|nr:FliH/SctL family protein [Polyangiales bacterium]